ncbi:MULTISPECIES: bifunctional 2-polyprenyl-6-hydroxyphenol methylase/3-demethylubiquinol 3-O-methyltransferase UbiG [Acidobacteriaceae]|uniref:class I SAM-dependent methyltransferase n=1 Tax=Acidobacteriaceae TaxID=204434 RepID=UPI00131D6A10|nr:MULTISPECIES: class I SAM-dependent methyltransferase [Acidobacteriaceae]MDW5265598.1 class I SAM-dependent methyltransferase [Edaphobacter sp.]
MGESSSFAFLPTFRDPAGHVEIKPDAVYRLIRSPFDAEILEFLALPLASSLVSEGRLVASEVMPRASDPASDSGALTLRHPRIAFQSYPWEWSPALWLAAAELTLDLCSDLIRQGWILKDATPLNVLFQGIQPIFVDVLSIQKMVPDQAIWYPYGQFVRTFLLPMLAYSRLGWPLQASLTRRDGYEPEEIYAALSWPKRLRQPALSSVTLPSLLANNKKLSDGSLSPRSVKDPEVVKHILLKTLKNLRAHMRQVTPAHKSSTWSDYAETATHYSDDDHTSKRSFIAQALAAAQPAHVLDVGCNTGVYSMLAAEAGAEVVSIDTDLQAVDRLCAKLKGSGKKVLPLCVDLAHPTPSVGWENSENASFLSRCCGHFDTVMMLAVIHHLLLRGQIPLDSIAALCSRLTTRNLILEWVPPTDPKFRELVRGRDSIYAHLTETAFREAFATHFTFLSEHTLQNGRILLHLQKNKQESQ